MVWWKEGERGRKRVEVYGLVGKKEVEMVNKSGEHGIFPPAFL